MGFTQPGPSLIATDPLFSPGPAITHPPIPRPGPGGVTLHGGFPVPNALAKALAARNVKRPLGPFVSGGTASQAASPSPVPPGGDVAPPSDPVATAAAYAQEAIQKAQDFQQYTETPPTFQPPDAPKENKARLVTDAIGMIFSNPRASASLSQGIEQRGEQAKSQYDQRYKEAQDSYTRELTRQQELAGQSDRRAAFLDKNADLAEKSLQNAITNKKNEDASLVAHQRADSYARSIVDRALAASNTDKRGWAQIVDNAKYRAQMIGVRREANMDGLERARIQAAASLQGKQIGASTALAVAGQRQNLALLLQRLNEMKEERLVSERGSIQQSIARTRDLLDAYTRVISASSAIGANPNLQAEAAALLQPPAKMGPDGKPVLGADGNPIPAGPSKYDGLVAQVARLGVSVPEWAGKSDLDAVTSEAHAGYLDGTLGTDPSLAGGAGVGGPTFNITIGGPGGGSPSAYVGQFQDALRTGTGAPPTSVPGGAVAVPPQYAPLVSSAETAASLPSGLLARVLSTESHFDPNAVSSAGARGIAQFMPKTAKDYGVDPTKPSSAIPGAAFYLRDLLKQFDNNPVLAVAAYNAGPGAVQQANGDLTKLPAETQDYVRKVFGSASAPASAQPAQATPNAQQPPKGRLGFAAKANPAATQQAHQQAKIQVDPQKATAAVKITTDNYDKSALRGRSFDDAWPQLKQTMIDKKVPVEYIKAIEPQVKAHIDHAYAASQKAEQDQAGKQALTDKVNFFKTQHPGVTDDVARREVTRESAPPPASPNLGGGGPARAQAPGPFVSQAVGRGLDPSGQALAPGTEAQIIAALGRPPYNVPPDRAKAMVAQALAAVRQRPAARPLPTSPDGSYASFTPV